MRATQAANQATLTLVGTRWMSGAGQAYYHTIYYSNSSVMSQEDSVWTNDSVTLADNAQLLQMPITSLHIIIVNYHFCSAVFPAPI